MKTEAKVGLFVFVGILFLFFLTTQVKEFSTMNKDGYKLYAKMDSVSGLELNSKVKINGLSSGYVKNMSIEGSKIIVEIFIYNGYRISKDSIAKLTQDSMIGGKNIEIVLGNSSEILNSNDYLKSEDKKLGFDEASDSIAKAANEFKSFIVEARNLFDKNSRKNLKKTFANLEKITNELESFVKADKFDKTLNDISTAGQKFGVMSDKFGQSADVINQRLNKIINQVDSLTKEFDLAGKNINKKLPDLLHKFSTIEDDIRAILKENKKPLNNTLVNASKFFASGDETFSKVDGYLNALARTKLEVSLKNEHMINDSFGKSTFSINYLPNPTRYYMLDVMSGDDYSKVDKNGELIYPKLHDHGKTYISAQLGKRYNDLLFRAGVIESRGGFGIDYFMLNDKLKASLDLYDFNAQNDIRGELPHARINLRYTFLKHLDAYAGYDNFLNSDADNFNLGVGIRFVDDDLKQLVGSVGIGNFAK